MSGTDKREAAYTQARTDLMQQLKDSGVSYLDQNDRGEHVARLVRHLSERYPELDDQMSRRLMGEGIRREAEMDDAPPPTME
jgi:hypothetical protein